MSQPDVPQVEQDQIEVPEPTADELRLAYRIGVHSRSVEERIVRLVSRGEVKFAIFGPGEEVHGTATALAFHKALNPDHFGIVPHYRSGSLCSMWCTLNGKTDFTLQMLRQQFSKVTDTMSRGRQMVYHLVMPEVGILPVQSPVGMQLGKAGGYALGFRHKGISDGVAVAVIGDGSTAEGDMHDAMGAAGVWDIPLIIIVTDNNIAISTTPDEGRSIKDFEAYARGYGWAYASCDGRDFFDVYETTYRAARYSKDHQKPLLLYVHDLPRFNGHSSAADVTFDLSQSDPLVHFGELLVHGGVIEREDAMRRIEGEGRDFFAHHELGRIMAAEDEAIAAIFDQVRAEPGPPTDVESLTAWTYAPFPEVEETQPGPGQTNVSYAGAIRSALDKLLARNNAWMVGQDVARLGGVMTASAGLKALHDDRVIDSPLNEPLLLGAATGLSMHDDLMALPEIQFGDYSLNTLHWLVYLGQLYWSTVGNASAKLMLRMPVDPFGGGAIYHSMSLDGYYTHIPGLVIIMPSTSFDVHGLMLTAGEYDGPVICLEPKWMYRQTLGPAFPGEPQDRADITALKKSVMRGEVPDLADVKIPFGKGVIRRAGADVTVVCWGRAVWTSLAAADTLAEQGIEVELIDLRTLVPPDMDLVLESVGRTGRLVVASEDRAFAGFAREIQGAVVDALPGTPSRAIGQKNVPGIAQCLELEDATILTQEDVVAAVTAVHQTELATSPAPSADAPEVQTHVAFVPHRYFIS